MREREPIDLIETAPGEWSFVRLLRLAAGRHFKADAEKRRERFFDSLSGNAVKPKPERLGPGAIAIVALTAIGCIVISLAGRPDLMYLVPMLIGVAVTVMIVLPGLMIGMSCRDILRSLIRP